MYSSKLENPVGFRLRAILRIVICLRTRLCFSGERVLRSRQPERGTSQDRRYKRSHRRSPSSGRQHSHVHGHRDRERDRERAHVGNPTSSRRTQAHRHHTPSTPSQETSRHRHRSPSSRSQVSTWVVTHPFLLFLFFSVTIHPHQRRSCLR